jgi:hypothetical protein
MNSERIVSPTKLCIVAESITTRISDAFPVEFIPFLVPQEANTIIANKQNAKPLTLNMIEGG